jgi:hypothetical protein
MRHVLRLEPLASASHDNVIATIAPNTQRFPNGPTRRAHSV